MFTTQVRRKRILGLALPIIGAMVSQNLLNLVDTAMVGHVDLYPNQSLAAVVFSGMVLFMATAFITGLSAGVQAIAARRKGEGRDTETAIALNGGLVWSCVLGVPIAILFYVLAPTIFSALLSDPIAVELGTSYFQISMFAVPAVGMNFSFRGYWNGVDLSKLYLRTLLAMHLVNVVLNYVLIFGHLGVEPLGADGAALGTTIATYFGLGFYIVLGLKHATRGGFLRAFPSRETLNGIMRVSLPTCVQQIMFAAGMTMFLKIVELVGTKAAAAASPLVRLTLVGILPGIAFGLAATTLVGQALGRNEPDDAEQWGRDVARLATVVIGLIGLPALIVPEAILSIFLTDPETLALAVWPLRLIGATLFLDAVGLVYQNALIGAGDTRTAMAVVVGMQWLVALPAAYIAGPMMGNGITAIWGAFLAVRVLQSALLAWLWRRGQWRQIRL